MFVGLIVIGAIYSVCRVQQSEHFAQRLILEMQQNIRGALVVLEQEIRMAGYDPEDTGKFGISDVRRYDIMDTAVNQTGQPALFFSGDFGNNTHDNGIFEAKEQIGFRIRQDRRVNRIFLTMSIGQSGRQRLAGNIEAICFAYAVDCNQDGRCDTWGGGRHLIWAVDSDNDNMLDVHLDTNDDGLIDLSDDSNHDNRITAADGTHINPPVALDQIKAVRVWMLAVSSKPLAGYCDNQIRLVGDRIIPAPGDQYRRTVMDTIVDCRNL